MRSDAIHREVVTAIVVSYNTCAALARCLASLRAASAEADLRVQVVDNASRDGSAEMVRRDFPEIRLRALRWNFGFGGAMNLALAEIRAGHVLWLNPDAELQPGALRAMLRALARSPRVGVVAPRLLAADGSLQLSLRRRSFYQPAHLILRATGIARLWPPLQRRLAADRHADWSHDTARAIDYANGACLLVAEPVARMVGLLDERFVIYSEDMDFCERTRRAGFEIRYVPAATVRHIGGHSTGQFPVLLRQHLVHAKWQLLGKHWGPQRARVYRLAVAIEALRSGLGSLRRHRPHSARLRLAAALLRWSLRPRVRPLPGAPPLQLLVRQSPRGTEEARPAGRAPSARAGAAQAGRSR